MFDYSYMGLNYPNFYPNKRYYSYYKPNPYFSDGRNVSMNSRFKKTNEFSTPNFSVESEKKDSSNQKNSTNENTSRSTIYNESTQKEQALFSILGLNLYFDDILILCLLFFLYTEEVKDEMLFICLIMLLLS